MIYSRLYTHIHYDNNQCITVFQNTTHIKQNIIPIQTNPLFSRYVYSIDFQLNKKYMYRVNVCNQQIGYYYIEQRVITIFTVLSNPI